jgi:hypothetical protein
VQLPGKAGTGLDDDPLLQGVGLQEGGFDGGFRVTLVGLKGDVKPVAALGG